MQTGDSVYLANGNYDLSGGIFLRNNRLIEGGFDPITLGKDLGVGTKITVTPVLQGYNDSPSGIYFYRLSSGSFEAVRSVIVLEVA